MSTNQTESLEQEAHAIIKNIYATYGDHPYMASRAHNYICQQLPQTLETIFKNYEQRQQRIEELTTEQDSFIQSFLNSNQYFYVPSTEKFFYYDGNNYKLYSEDDILYHVLSSISQDRQLMSWKQRTKVYVMKRIKENSLLKSVPESETIQRALSLLYPAFFSTKTEAKYFLTILGDNIFKKNTDLIHFIDADAKHFIRELNTMSQGFLGVQLSQSLKYKYHEHDYSQCRILKINESIKNTSLWKSILLEESLNLLCVACHYSTRFHNSDEYLLQHSNDNTLIHQVFYLKDSTPESMVSLFISEYVQKNMRSDSFTESTSTVVQITWKNMQYLWKHFLESKHLPMIIFQQNLKTFFIQKLGEYYKDEVDSFIGISSKYLPAMQKFINFWEETITFDENELEMEYEIDEMCVMFKLWCERNGESASVMNQKQIIDLIMYFFPTIEIENEKYLYKIRCSIWDKTFDIQMAIEHMQESVNKNGLNNPYTVSIYDAYLFYCKNCQNTNLPLIVSKSYFEKYVCETMSSNVVDNKFLVL